MADATPPPPARLHRADVAKMAGSLLLLTLCLTSIAYAPYLAGPEDGTAALMQLVHDEANAAYVGSDCAAVLAVAGACPRSSTAPACAPVRASFGNYSLAIQACREGYSSWSFACVFEASPDRVACLQLHRTAAGRKTWCAYDSDAARTCWRQEAHAAVTHALVGCAPGACPLALPDGMP